jgi:hypothetical protein
MLYVHHYVSLIAKDAPVSLQEADQRSLKNISQFDLSEDSFDKLINLCIEYGNPEVAKLVFRLLASNVTSSKGLDLPSRVPKNFIELCLRSTSNVYEQVSIERYGATFDLYLLVDCIHIDCYVFSPPFGLC